MFSRKMLVTGLMAGLLAACSGSSGGGSGDGGGGGGGGGGGDPTKPSPTPTATPPPFETPTPTPTPPANKPVKEGAKGTYKATDAFKDEKDYKDYVFNVGCKATGDTTPVLQVDPRLKKGMSFLDRSEGSNATDGYQMVGQSIDILDILSSGGKATGFVAQLTIKEVENIPDLQPGATGKIQCQINAKGELDCSQAAVAALRKLSALSFDPMAVEKDCEVKEKSEDDVVGNVSKGTYTFVGGKTVKGYELTLDVKGDLLCEGKVVGAGVERIHVIRSNEVPSLGTNYCGGTMLYFFRSVGRAGVNPIESGSADLTWVK